MPHCSAPMSKRTGYTELLMPLRPLIIRHNGWRAGCYQEICLEAYTCFSLQQKGPKKDPTYSPVKVGKAACQRDNLAEVCP